MACYLGFQPTDEKDYYFISYNSEDVGKIGPIVQKLNDSAVPLWYDYGLEYGEKWESEISGRIKDAKAIIMFFTKGILDKEESYVRKEYNMATKFYEKKVYVVLLDKINKADVPYTIVPWWIDVESRHCIDASENGRIDILCEEIKKALKFEKNISTNSTSNKQNKRISVYNNQKEEKIDFTAREIENNRTLIAHECKQQQTSEYEKPISYFTNNLMRNSAEDTILMDEGKSIYKGQINDATKSQDTDLAKAFEILYECCEKNGLKYDLSYEVFDIEHYKDIEKSLLESDKLDSASKRELLDYLRNDMKTNAEIISSIDDYIKRNDLTNAYTLCKGEEKHLRKMDDPDSTKYLYQVFIRILNIAIIINCKFQKQQALFLYKILKDALKMLSIKDNKEDIASINLLSIKLVLLNDLENNDSIEVNNGIIIKKHLKIASQLYCKLESEATKYIYMDDNCKFSSSIDRKYWAYKEELEFLEKIWMYYNKKTTVNGKLSKDKEDQKGLLEKNASINNTEKYLYYSENDCPIMKRENDNQQGKEKFDFNTTFEKVIKSFKNNAFQKGNPIALNNELSDQYFKYKGESIFAIISNCKEKYVEDFAIWKRDFFFETEVLNEDERLFFLQEFNKALLKREEDCFRKLRIINYLDYLDFLFAVDTSNILYLFRQEHLKILDELSKQFENEIKIIARIYTYIGKFIEMDSDKKCEAKKYYKKSLDLFWECEKIEQKEVEDDEDFINDLEYQDDVRSGGALFYYKEISKLNDYIKCLG